MVLSFLLLEIHAEKAVSLYIDETAHGYILC